MPVYIHNIENGVPETEYPQDYIRDLMKELVSDKELTRRIIHRIYSQSGIEKRHSVIRNFEPIDGPRQFFQSENGKLTMPSTKRRNEIYTQESRKLYSDIARKTIENTPELSLKDITHVITVSCTGFYAPGPDFYIVKDLGLPKSTQRFHIGFMGCYATFPALKMAKQFCEASPDAVVLVVSLELCTLHLQFREEADFLISASLFADGGGGAIVSARKPADPVHSFELNGFSTCITPSGEEDMAWTIGNNGFDMVLSTYVPKIIETNLESALQPLLESLHIERNEIDLWAIHPGGRAILDKIQNGLNLQDVQVAVSRNILRNYGNMSSATILFVLREMLKNESSKSDEKIYAMAFGPGLTIESGLLTKNPVIN